MSFIMRNRSGVIKGLLGIEVTLRVGSSVTLPEASPYEPGRLRPAHHARMPRLHRINDLRARLAREAGSSNAHYLTPGFIWGSCS
ncbi:hypothetical protein [Mesorhizobium japonicum]|uniref:hypothetical protein n=1 Tax=Mesorhizobium japonicum TaxID=2066070 RepID=UPI001389F7E3|nr:hypothetical protein [Mesorhizobium japonicum]